MNFQWGFLSRVGLKWVSCSTSSSFSSFPLLCSGSLLRCLDWVWSPKQAYRIGIANMVSRKWSLTSCCETWLTHAHPLCFQPDDPENPMNWPNSKKWFITMLLNLMCFFIGWVRGREPGMIEGFVLRFLSPFRFSLPIDSQTRHCRLFYWTLSYGWRAWSLDRSWTSRNVPLQFCIQYHSPCTVGIVWTNWLDDSVPCQS